MSVSARGKPSRNNAPGSISDEATSRAFLPSLPASRIENEQLIAIEPFASTGIGLIHNGMGGNIYIFS